MVRFLKPRKGFTFQLVIGTDIAQCLQGSEFGLWQFRPQSVEFCALFWGEDHIAHIADMGTA